MAAGNQANAGWCLLDRCAVDQRDAFLLASHVRVSSRTAGPLLAEPLLAGRLLGTPLLTRPILIGRPGVSGGMARVLESLQSHMRQLAQVQFAEHWCPRDKNRAPDDSGEAGRLSREQPDRHVDDVAEYHDAEHDSGNWLGGRNRRKRRVQ